MKPNADVAVVGGGLAGTAAAVITAAAGLTVLHFAPPAAPDRRTSALMGPSIDLLVNAGLITDPATAGTALSRIRLIDATGRLVRAGETLFDATEFGFEAFGYNIANTVLAERFASRVAELGQLREIKDAAGGFRREAGGFSLEAGGTRHAVRLLVGADGRGSAVRDFAGIPARTEKYRQSALVADLKLERPLGSESVEFHYENGPFTLVPAGEDKANLVWIDRRETLEAVRERARLNAAIVEKSSRLFGEITVTAGPHVFELVRLAAAAMAAPGVVLVGEAGHAIPPIGAQGLNLGLRDAAVLGELAGGIDTNTPDWPQTLSAKYGAARLADVARTGMLVEGLFRSLVAGFLPADIARSAGLMALRNIPALRRAAFETGMGRR